MPISNLGRSHLQSRSTPGIACVEPKQCPGHHYRQTARDLRRKLLNVLGCFAIKGRSGLHRPEPGNCSASVLQSHAFMAASHDHFRYWSAVCSRKRSLRSLGRCWRRKESMTSDERAFRPKCCPQAYDRREYDLLTFNCCHFADDFARTDVLGTGA